MLLAQAPAELNTPNVEFSALLPVSGPSCNFIYTGDLEIAALPKAFFLLKRWPNNLSVTHNKKALTACSVPLSPTDQAAYKNYRR